MRTALLQLVATPDRAWLTLLAGSMLLAREFTAPGRVLPGVLGGLGLVLGGFGLWPVSPGGAALFSLTLVLLAVQAWWARPWPGMIAAAVCGTVTARYLADAPRQISFPAALATVPAAGVLAWLLWVARRAYINKVRNGSNSSR
jgi:membrane-bound serine protease (ClpP class)